MLLKMFCQISAGGISVVHQPFGARNDSFLALSSMYFVYYFLYAICGYTNNNFVVVSDIYFFLERI